jgi:hypothetical protein
MIAADDEKGNSQRRSINVDAHFNSAGEVFLRSFFVRRDVYGKEVSPPQNVIAVKSPVTLDVINLHFAGKQRIGAYTTSAEDRCLYGCIDIDHDKPELSLEQRGSLITLGPALVEAALRRGLRLFLELTKSLCWHDWLFAEEPISAAAMRRILLMLLRDCGVVLPPGGCGWIGFTSERWGSASRSKCGRGHRLAGDSGRNGWLA